MDTLGIKFDVSTDDEGHRRNWNSERWVVWTETAGEFGRDHSAKVSLFVFEGQHICDRAMLADCVADQHDSALRSRYVRDAQVSNS
jgi:hypothetical protein